MAEATKRPLSEEVAAKYEIKGVSGGKCILPERFGRKAVDFSTMTLAEADELANLKDFPYLVPKKGQQAVKVS